LPTTEPTRRRLVFINCPFDDAYRPLLRAACFALLACGYRPRCALDDSDSGRLRFPAILDMIAGCDLSIHDISRVEIDPVSNLPRFNMALELGADLALRLRGPKFHRSRRTLVLDAEPHRYDQTLSDISGMDIAIHHNQRNLMIRQVRDWLNTAHAAVRPLPGGSALIEDHEEFLDLAPAIISNLRLEDSDALTHADYLYVVEEALAEMSRRRTVGLPAA
jgi:hypothetical protein